MNKLRMGFGFHSCTLGLQVIILLRSCPDRSSINYKLLETAISETAMDVYPSLFRGKSIGREGAVRNTRKPSMGLRKSKALTDELR